MEKECPLCENEDVVDCCDQFPEKAADLRPLFYFRVYLRE
jgi:hypothetical protein